jgi:hypothetical protein
MTEPHLIGVPLQSKPTAEEALMILPSKEIDQTR